MTCRVHNNQFKSDFIAVVKDRGFLSVLIQNMINDLYCIISIIGIIIFTASCQANSQQDVRHYE